MERILVVGVNWLGDCVMSLPVFKAIKERFPQSFLALMVVERVKELFEDNPYVDKIIVFNEKTTHRGFFAKLKFIKYLKKEKFDTAFLIHRSFTRAFILWLVGIKKRVGFKRAKTHFILTDRITPPLNVHRSLYYYSLFEQEGVAIEDKLPNFYIDDKEREKVDNFLLSYRRNYRYLVAINPTANWELKRWPDNYFVELIENLLSIGCAIFLIGAKGEKNYIDNMEKKIKGKVINLCGKTNLKELAALLSRMDLLISSDSGPAHLGSAVGINVLVLFGPTDPLITAPLGKNVHILKKDVGCKIPCYNLNCKDNICIRELKVEEVFIKARSILTKNEG
ncbi:MAG: lipopolysaccharide heptosyltransferase II [Candidatus Omnitrophica bacterium]|nr:lipopolysaccharide heptosyltransferase II [Candidatus Omnitrophota bacterium]